jgi:PelA/Pel-15E family pectate lyase
MRFLLLLAAILAVPESRADDAELRARAALGLKRAVGFFVEQIACEGGYLWRYSEDLAKREGEGRATATTVWVQPPGTPTVGAALLQVYRDTGDAYYLEAARRAGYCLARGQLKSGGWDYRIEFDRKRRGEFAYRLEPAPGKQTRNVTTLDDNNTQSALRFLMELDEVLSQGDAKIHDAAQYALRSLLAAQYPNGAWPQRFEVPPDPAACPVKKASYPETWSRTFPKQKYGTFYTFNDDVMGDMVATLLDAARIYGDQRYRQAALRTGDFMILAQMPEPQPGWAQQYDLDMHPAWARKFEPPSITGGESHDVVRTLLRLYVESSDRKYLEPIPRALAYYRRSLLPDGRLARFYELKTNKPLYFTRADYQLTYSDADMPTHYSFKIGNWLPNAESAYERVVKLTPQKLAAERAARSAKPAKHSGRVNRSIEDRVRKLLAAMDERGRWVDDAPLHYQGADDATRRTISTETFSSNVRTLAAYLAAGRKP